MKILVVPIVITTLFLGGLGFDDQICRAAEFVVTLEEEEPAAEPNPLPLLQVDKPSSGEKQVEFEVARMLERVERRYAEALAAYESLIAAKPQGALFENASLGIARCLIKLGRYDEAAALLAKLSQRHSSPEFEERVQALQAAVERLRAPERIPSAPTVDNLAWQLLDIATSGDEETRSSARKDLQRMGELAVPVLKEAALDADFLRSELAFVMLAKIRGDESLTFFERCAASDDMALRLRCLKGIRSTTRWGGGGFVRLLRPYLLSSETVLQKAALEKLQYSIDFALWPTEALDEFVLILAELSANRDADLRSKVLYWIDQLNRYTSNSKWDDSSLVELCADWLDLLWDRRPLDGARTFELDELMRTVTLKDCVLRDNIRLAASRARFWAVGPLENSKIARSALYAACQLPPEELRGLIEEFVVYDDVAVLRFFLSNCPLETVTALPDELQCSLLRSWARRDTGQSLNESRSDQKLGKLLQTDWNVLCWAALVDGALQNDDYAFRQTLLSGLSTCPALRDPGCFEALCRWATEEDVWIARAAFKQIEQLLNTGLLTPDRHGVLAILHESLAALVEPIKITDRGDGDGRIEVRPKITMSLFHLITCCIECGDLDTIVDWLIAEHEIIPGLLDGAVGWKSLSEHLLSRNELVAAIWPRLSATGREVLFEKIYRKVAPDLALSNQGWLVPLLSAWQPDPAWVATHAEQLLALLRSLDDPRLDELNRETLARFVESTAKKSDFSMKAARDLLIRRGAQTLAIMELVPRWYDSLPPNARQSYKPNLVDMVCSSRDHLEMALAWLAEDCSSDCKERVIKTVFQRKYPPHYARINIAELLRSRWNAFEVTVRRDIFERLAVLFQKMIESEYHDAGGLAGWDHDKHPDWYCASFLEFLINDDTIDPAAEKELAIVLLLASGVDALVEPCVAAIVSFDPRSASQKNDNGQEVERAETYDSIKEEMIKKLYKLKGSTRYAMNGFENPARRKLARAFLTQPGYDERIQEMAALALELDDPTDFRLLMEVARRPVGTRLKEEIFKKITGFLAQADEATAPNSQQRLVALLTEALTDESDGFPFSGLATRAFRIIAAHEIEALLPTVSESAKNGRTPEIRWDAIRCLGSFLSAETVPVLLACLKDSEKSVREEATAVLERLRSYNDYLDLWHKASSAESAAGDRRVKSPSEELLELLQSEVSAVRQAAVKSLIRLNDPNVLPALVRLMVEGNEDECAAAQAAVEAIAASKPQDR